jgi:hypothetical protein
MGEHGEWSLSSEEAIATLGLKPVEYWQTVHSLRERIHVLDAVDGYNQDSVGELVTVAERLAGREAEEVMFRAGVFLPHSARAELTGELLELAEGFALGHAIDVDELAAMLRFTGNVPRALALYLGEHADLGRMIEESAAAFASSRRIARAGQLTAARGLRELFSRHIMEKAALFAGLERRLREEARRLGFAEVEEEESPRQDARAGESAGAKQQPAKGRGRLAWARGVMGLPAGPVAFDELRRRYRELIMRFHPDVNPSGLERCKDITAAYSLLAARAGEGVVK